MMTTFEGFFEAATGWKPHGYQARVAREGLPDVVEAPTGTGKTGVILAWLWRRLHGTDPSGTPRRIIYALPQRSLVEQVAGEARKWLDNLDLADKVALHVVMGGRPTTLMDWRLDMHKPAIVVGTVDSLVSKALNRGYGIARATYPIDFALVCNGAHWVLDEIQLCPEATTTVRQLAAFAKRFGTAEPFGLTCMSATVDEGLLKTVDHREIGEVIQIREEERTGQLKVRLDAARTFRRLSTEPGEYKGIAAAIADRHQLGTLTLAVFNTVDAARTVYKHLRYGPTDVTLLHSRFRGMERAKLMADVIARPEDRIVIATQVVEAGIDLSSLQLFTEAAPWPSLIQRAGRCNRTGGRNADATVWWLPPAKPLPYKQEDIDATSAELDGLEGETLTGEDLLARDVPVARDQVAVIRRSDFVGLFDTSPDLSGADTDISPYIRDADDRDAEVAWATWVPGENGQPAPEAKAPAAEYRCRVSLVDVARLARDRAVWRLDQVAGSWVKITAQGPQRARPGEVLVIGAADGGYDPQTGLDPSAKGAVADSPPLLTKAELAAAEDAFAADSASQEQKVGWQSLDQHSSEVRAQAEALLQALAPAIPNDSVASAITAGYLHDVGKAYPMWQDALCNLATADERADIADGRPWAKSARSGKLVYEGGVTFRHELASLLLVDGPLRHLLAGAPDQDLARYLVLSHHGKLRIQVRDPGDAAVVPNGEAADRKVLGLTQDATAEIPALLGQPAATLTVDLDQFQLGGDRSWTRTALGLRDKYGPLVLAYLETVVRIADWRASGAKELASDRD
jgi:CRISPR-associated endonuclease/helicase Cas3